MRECEKLSEALQELHDAQMDGRTGDDPWDGLGDASFLLDDGLAGLRAGASNPDGIYACTEDGVAYVFACASDEACARVRARIGSAG